MTLDQPLVPLGEPQEVSVGGPRGELPHLAAVTGPAGQDEVPDLVQVHRKAPGHQAVREEVVDVRVVDSRCRAQDDPAEAIEAVALLVAVQGWADLADRPPFPDQRGDEDLPRAVVEDAEHLPIRSRFPRGFHEPPPCLALVGQVGDCRWVLAQPEELISQRDAPDLAPSLVREEPLLDLAIPHHVEGVDDVVEAP